VALARGNLTQGVAASGTVNPQDTVSVGTQVSGTIQSLYVDFNSRVHTGQLLAKIDPSQFQAQLDQANAALAQARAQAAASGQTATGATYASAAANSATSGAQSTVAKARAAWVLARQTLARDRSLLTRGYIAQSQYDADYANALAAENTVRAAQAAVSQNSALSLQSSATALGSFSNAQAAQSAVQAAEALVRQDALNLQRTTIASPVDGTIVARNVSVGQTVAASFQTPTLFTIAQDLKKMEVDIAVGEPDIGNVRQGDAVDFSVLAYPNRTFHGTVSQVRVNPTTVANVVTYTVVVLVDNSSNALLPGMTANTSIAVASVKNALLVPLQALTYRPARTRQSGRSLQAAGTSPWGATGSDVSGAIVAGSKGVVFAMRDGAPRGVPVRVVLVSGLQAAIQPLRELRVGESIVVEDSEQGSRVQHSGTTSPISGVRSIR
jgi:HlyD family secretion protein